MWQKFTNCQVPFIFSLQGSSWRVGGGGCWEGTQASSRAFPSSSRLLSASNLGVNPSSFWAFLLSKEFSSKSRLKFLWKTFCGYESNLCCSVYRCIRWASFAAEDKDSNPVQPLFFSGFTFNLSSFCWEIIFPFLWKHHLVYLIVGIRNLFPWTRGWCLTISRIPCSCDIISPNLI